MQTFLQICSLCYGLLYCFAAFGRAETRWGQALSVTGFLFFLIAMIGLVSSLL